MMPPSPPPRMVLWFQFSAPRGEGILSRESPAAMARRYAGRILGKDAPDHRRLFRIDGAVAGLVLDKIIAIGDLAGEFSQPRSAIEAAPDLLGEIFDEIGIHQAAHGDLHGVGFAVANGVQRYLRMLQPLEKSVYILLIAGK